MLELERDSESAHPLLERHDLLSVMVSDLDAMGTVGEAENKQVLFLAMVSRLLERPVNVVVKGPSSSGKSYLVRSVGELFGDDAVLSLSAITPRALYHMREEELCHRVLFVDEYLADAGRDHALRLMQSEGRLIMMMTQRSGEGFGTRTRTVKGPIAFITTTTRSSIFDENETRAFALQTDCSEAQTQRIHDAQRRFRSFDRPQPQHSKEEWQSALDMLAPQKVAIPFAEHIHLASTGQARDRRDLGRILSLVEASALLHQLQRAEVQHDGEKWLVADLEDYRVAYRLARAFLASTPTPDTQVEDVLTACRSLGEEAASHYQLMDILGWSRPTVIKYCQQAVSAGRLRQVEGANGGQKRYRRVEGAPTGALTSPDEVAARIERSGPTWR